MKEKKAEPTDRQIDEHWHHWRSKPWSISELANTIVNVQPLARRVNSHTDGRTNRAGDDGHNGKTKGDTLTHTNAERLSFVEERGTQDLSVLISSSTLVLRALERKDNSTIS